MSTSQQSGWFSKRTKFVTAVSVVAVSLAGATAVGANIGILDSADNSTTGTLSAAGDLTPPTAQVVDVYVDDTAPATSVAAPVAAAAPVAMGAPAPEPHEYAVDAAGTVRLVVVDGGLRLDSAAPAQGWSWTLTQASPTDLRVTFTNGTRTLEFRASVGADGSIAASVDEPIVTPAPSSPVATSQAGTHGDNESDDGGEYEGGEYEGGGDDD